MHLTILHWAWRHAWGIYETTGNRFARFVFNTLDATHDRVAYPDHPAGWGPCSCPRA